MKANNRGGSKRRSNTFDGDLESARRRIKELAATASREIPDAIGLNVASYSLAAFLYNDSYGEIGSVAILKVRALRGGSWSGDHAVVSPKRRPTNVACPSMSSFASRFTCPL